jgi:hypothetical protein
VAAQERDRQRKRRTDLAGSREKISTSISSGSMFVEASWLLLFRTRLAVVVVVGVCDMVCFVSL